MALLSLRGLLKCPEEYNSILIFLNNIGIDIELSKEFLYNRLQAQATLNKTDKVIEIENSITKLLSPDSKSEEENLMQQAEDVLVKDKNNFIRIKTRANHTIKSETPLEDIKKLITKA